jgi:hypothetical protein
MTESEHKAPIPTADRREQHLEAFEKAVRTARSASQLLDEANDDLVDIALKAKASLTGSEFQEFWLACREICPEYLLPEIEDAFDDVDGDTNQDDYETTA